MEGGRSVEGTYYLSTHPWIGGFNCRSSRIELGIYFFYFELVYGAPGLTYNDGFGPF